MAKNFLSDAKTRNTLKVRARFYRRIVRQALNKPEWFPLFGLLPKNGRTNCPTFGSAGNRLFLR